MRESLALFAADCDVWGLEEGWECVATDGIQYYSEGSNSVKGIFCAWLSTMQDNCGECVTWMSRKSW